MKQKADVWTQLDAVRSEAGLVEDETPPDAITIAEYRQRYHVSDKTARTQLDTLVSKGVLMHGRTRRAFPNGRFQMCAVYWPKEKS